MLFDVVSRCYRTVVQQLCPRSLLSAMSPERTTAKEICTTDDRKPIENCVDAACRHLAVRMKADIDAKIGALYTATLPPAEPRYTDKTAESHTHQAALDRLFPRRGDLGETRTSGDCIWEDIRSAPRSHAWSCGVVPLPVGFPCLTVLAACNNIYGSLHCFRVFGGET
jgi:hypothetical protein